MECSNYAIIIIAIRQKKKYEKKPKKKENKRINGKCSNINLFRNHTNVDLQHSHNSKLFKLKKNNSEPLKACEVSGINTCKWDDSLNGTNGVFNITRQSCDCEY